MVLGIQWVAEKVGKCAKIDARKTATSYGQGLLDQGSSLAATARQEYTKSGVAAEAEKAKGMFNCIDQCMPDLDDAEVTTFSNGCCICCVSSHHTPMEFSLACAIM
mmetsp:Transcript_17588/g.57688  ORF Transcript_17588/g.57688 Transcript_17588/m.57688 type:complete len:106 (+) Transcript_17588:108-425(+)